RFAAWLARPKSKQRHINSAAAGVHSRRAASLCAFAQNKEHQMEIDVTHMVENADQMIELSGSRAEHGENASRITWDNSKAYAADQPLLTTDAARAAACHHFRGCDGW